LRRRRRVAAAFHPQRGFRQFHAVRALGIVEGAFGYAVAVTVHPQRAVSAQQRQVLAHLGADRILGGGLGGRRSPGWHVELAGLVAARRRRRAAVLGDAVGVLPRLDRLGRKRSGQQQGGWQQRGLRETGGQGGHGRR